MNAFTDTPAITNNGPIAPLVTPVKNGESFSIGEGFDALAFRERDFSGAMDPLVMVDHYRMTQPTFGPHPHAGLSAVSVIFEDSEGPFHNRDSLGNDFDIMPGDLYWLKAGSGVIHDESPRTGSNIHGLQVFVNLPAALRKSTPRSLHIKASDMPRIVGNGYRVRIVLGQSNGVSGYPSPALPMTILDGLIESGNAFSHQLLDRENAWLTVIKGEVAVSNGSNRAQLLAGQAIAISDVTPGVDNHIQLVNAGTETAQFALFTGIPVKEKFVQKGPFIMGSISEIAQVEAKFAAGEFGAFA